MTAAYVYFFVVGLGCGYLLASIQNRCEEAHHDR